MKKYFKAIWLFLRVKDVRVLSILPEDILVVRTGIFLENGSRKQFIAVAREALSCCGIKNKLIVLDPGEDIGVIRQFEEGE